MSAVQAESLQGDLIQILRAVTIVSPQAFAFAGRLVSAADMPSFGYPPRPGGALGQAEANPLVGALQSHLYQYCYCVSFKNGRTDFTSPISPDPAFVPALSAANTSRERWDPGWQISAMVPGGQIIVLKGALVRAVWPGEFLMHGGTGMAPGVGAPVSLYMPRESTVMQPGFYFAFGEAAGDWHDDGSLLRFYWNVKDSGAAALLTSLTTQLNRFRVPFRYKCLTTKEAYARVDAAVLYVAKRLYRITAEVLFDVHAQVAAHLDPETPLFTKQLAPGLGFAEDPGVMESFGTSRCRLLAEGIWAAFVQGVHDERARLQIVAQHFEKSGISLEAPYLNPGSHDSYTFPAESDPVP
jgi:hypothetical protein